MDRKKQKTTIDVEIMETDGICNMQDGAHQQLMISRNDINRLTINCPQLPTTGEVVYAFIVTRGARSNTYLKYSAHHSLMYSLPLFTFFIIVPQPCCTPTLTPSPPTTLLAYFSSLPSET